ncbi:fatty-acid amide hydrolase 2-A [Stomoxys calcitrans]|uniref:fatty-acid amide hydrolase 2-A n=1 Tax=Stomoxys calcitrans TaxID=35570 RepID=UPI0027E2D88F|nr:fatty-acid amide hydrolase 2-A [Stomoxys calcitrans]XP_013109062.2 fatty-acid amide hydrolase 2-A [Stomoxys calcitrans]XP_013109063.2 fatty-acid amide hydrolase 2-A [Stomoxys calcitrans]
MTENNAFTTNNERRKRSSSRRSSTSRSHRTPSRRKGGSSFLRIMEDVFFRLYTMFARFIFKLVYGVKGQSMPAITDPILLESATSLAKKIRRQELTSVQVLESFFRRAKEVNPLLNCMVDERFDDAMKEAKEADELIKSGKFTEEELAEKLPFLGVPISTKDCIAVKGMLHTSGLYERRNHRASEDADTIALMRKAGAIPFALTNVSEVCMWWESNNTVHGRTRNPYDTNRIVGGSSGGEGCIQGAAASPFGLGSDIGGSIRMPAYFNGIFGHKPSKFVVSNMGQFPLPVSEEQNSFLGVGPMVRHAEDLKPVLKIIAGEKAPLLKLDETVDVQKLKFFYQETDGGSRLVSPVDEDIIDGIHRIVDHLQMKLKVPVEQVQLPLFKQSATIWFANMKDDSGHGFDYQLGNCKRTINTKLELVKWLFRSSKHTLIGLFTALLDKSQPQHGSSKYYHLVKKRDALREELQQLLGENGVLIYPTHPTVAPYHNEPIVRPLNFSYTAIINVLGFPATTIPLGKLGSEGLPLGVQVIANFNQDRLCLAVAEELEKAFGGWARPEIRI